MVIRLLHGALQLSWRVGDLSKHLAERRIIKRDQTMRLRNIWLKCRLGRYLWRKLKPLYRQPIIQTQIRFSSDDWRTDCKGRGRWSKTGLGSTTSPAHSQYLPLPPASLGDKLQLDRSCAGPDETESKRLLNGSPQLVARRITRVLVLIIGWTGQTNSPS